MLALPPLPPRARPVSLADDDGPSPMGRFRLRLIQVTATIITVLLTCWLCTLGAIPAIIGLSVAKHILVAILVMGLGVDAPTRQTP